MLLNFTTANNCTEGRRGQRKPSCRRRNRLLLLTFEHYPSGAAGRYSHPLPRRLPSPPLFPAGVDNGTRTLPDGRATPAISRRPAGSRGKIREARGDAERRARGVKYPRVHLSNRPSGSAIRVRWSGRDGGAVMRWHVTAFEWSFGTIAR